LVVVLIGAKNGTQRRKRFLLLSGLGLVGSLALMLAWKYGAIAVPAFLGGDAARFFSAPSRAWQFAAGLMLAGSTSVQVWLTRLRLLRLLGFGLIILSAFAFSDSSGLPGLGTLVPVIGALVLLAGGPATGPKGFDPLGTALTSQAAQWIGDRSYSLYLWHWPAVVFVKWTVDNPPVWILVVATVASVVPATASFRFVEVPARRWSPRRPNRVVLLAATCVLVPLGASWILGQGSSRGWGQDWTLGSHEIKRRDCDSGAFDPERCTWPGSGGSAPVVIVGDSQAWSYGDAVIQAARAGGRDTIALVLNNCPFVGASSEAVEIIGSGSCFERQQDVLGFLANTRPSHVVIASLTSGYVSSAATAEVWSIAMREVYSTLAEFEIKPVLVLAAPLGDSESGSASLLLRPPKPRTTDREMVEADRSIAVGADLQAASEFGVRVVDPADVLCSELQCEVADESGELYSDANHLSLRAVRRLTPTFSDIFEVG
jgi:hypothetical protein